MSTTTTTTSTTTSTTLFTLFSQEKIKLCQSKAQFLIQEQEMNINDHYSGIRIILDYCLRKEKIIYGGIALDTILRSMKLPGIYDANFDRPDIEFYSSIPQENVIELCDFIFDQNAENRKHYQIDSREAAHSSTFKISQDYHELCDVSYLDPKIEEFLKNSFSSKIKNVYYANLELMFLDKLRVFSNPGSYNRLEKEIKRLELFKNQVDISKFKNIEIVGSKVKIGRNNEINETTVVTNVTNVVDFHCTDIKYFFFLQTLQQMRSGLGIKFMVVNGILERGLVIITEQYDMIKTLVLMQFQKQVVNIVEFHPFSFITDGKCQIQLQSGDTVHYIEIHRCSENSYNYVKQDLQFKDVKRVNEESKVLRHVNVATKFVKLLIAFSSSLQAQINQVVQPKYLVSQTDLNVFRDIELFYKELVPEFIGDVQSKIKNKILRNQLKQLTGHVDFTYNPEKPKKKAKCQWSFTNMSGKMIQ